MMVLTLLFLINAAFGVPDVSLGYRYQIPSTSYGTPIGSSHLTNVNRQYYHVDVRGSIPNSIGPTVPSREFQTPIREHYSFNGAGNSLSGGLSPGITTNIGISANRSPQPFDFDSKSSFLNQQAQISGVSSPSKDGASQTVTSGFTDSRSSFLNQRADVQRHVYFYAAPEEPEELRTRINVPVEPPKKNVKIIFIKAPSYGAAAPINIPVQPQNEEKTLVYVLVKKPDEQATFNIPTPAPTKPSKPEVYFIKYRTQKDAQEAIANVQSGVTAGGLSVGANTVEGDQDFINTIGQDLVSRNHDNGVSLTSSSFPDSRNVDAGSLSLEQKINLSSENVESGGVNTFGGSSTSSSESVSSDFSSGSGEISFLTPQSTTASSLDSFDIASRTSGETGVHKLYGPPKI